MKIVKKDKNGNIVSDTSVTKVVEPQVIERVIIQTEQVETIKVLKTVEELKAQMVKEVKEKFISISEKPRVEVVLPRTSQLVLYVDGSRNNKDDFRTKWELMRDSYTAEDGTLVPEETTTVRDSDNSFVTDVTKSEMFLIWTAIVANGEALYEWKWGKEQEISACNTIEELEAVEI